VEFLRWWIWIWKIKNTYAERAVREMPGQKEKEIKVAIWTLFSASLSYSDIIQFDVAEFTTIQKSPLLLALTGLIAALSPNNNKKGEREKGFQPACRVCVSFFQSSIHIYQHKIRTRGLPRSWVRAHVSRNPQFAFVIGPREHDVINFIPIFSSQVTAAGRLLPPGRLWLPQTAAARQIDTDNFLLFLP
jgi:hypothetical protein